MASDVKWIKIVTDIFDDEKILLIESMPESDSIIVIWFKLLCFCGKQNNGGILMLNERIAYTDEMLSTIFRRPLNTVRLALRTFEQYGMVEIENDVITVTNWGKHQDLDRIQKGRENTRKRVAAYRERQKLAMKSGDISCECTEKAECNGYGNADVTVTVTPMLRNVTPIEREGEGEGEGEREKTRTAKRFTPPTVEEVQTYCQERQNNIDAERFVDYYTSNGWKVGKNAMKDWKATVRTWEKKEYGYGGKHQTKPKQPDNSGLSGTQQIMAWLNEDD